MACKASLIKHLNLESLGKLLTYCLEAKKSTMSFQPLTLATL